MTIETTRQMIIERLERIRSIPKQTYSAEELHSGMMSRVQRQADTQYQQRVKLRERKLLADLKVVDKYLLDREAEKQALAVMPQTGDEFGLLETPLIPVPEVSIWSQSIPIPFPQRRFTRTSTKIRLNKRRRRK